MTNPMKFLITLEKYPTAKPCKEAFKQNGRWYVIIENMPKFSAEHNHRITIDFDIEEQKNIIVLT